MFKVLTLAILVGLAASTTAVAGVPRATTVIYETGPCFGFCPVYRVSVTASGHGLFTGIRNTKVIGKRSFRVSRRQYQAFVRRLAPVRPVGERLLTDQTQCPRFATDMPSVDVRWLTAGLTSHLAYNFGCDREANATMVEALRVAPKALPIGSMIGSH
jgi:hypothetical protein